MSTGDRPPIRKRPYSVSDAQRGIVEEHVTDMLYRDVIQPSTIRWAAPIILVKKKDGTDSFVVDFRRLNAVTRKDSYPLPRIDDAFMRIHGTERILKSRKRHGKLQYLVKWANYPVSESKWEPEENILDQRLLDDFHEKNK